MPSNVTAYYILIDAEDDLEQERRAFGDVVHEYNAAEALPRDVLFVPLGWESGSTSSRRWLRKDFRKVDFFLLLLWDRWPAGGEKELEIALECEGDPGAPMQQVVPFFKTVDDRRLSDPGHELRQVVTLREQLADRRERRFETFDTPDEFAARLRQYLSSWLVAHEKREQPIAALTNPEVEPADTATTELGWQPPPSEDTPEGLNQLGLFLQRSDKLEEAEAMHRRALELGFPFDAMAIAYGNLGVICRWRREFDQAQTMFRKALALSEQLERPLGIAACYVGLGTVHRQAGDLDSAEQMFRSALQVEEKMNRPEGMVSCYRHLATVADERGDTDEGKRLRALADAESAEPEYPLGALFPSRI